MRIATTVMSILFAFSLYCCVPEEIILHGDIHGNVGDADLKQPLDGAIVTLKQSQTTRDIDTTDIAGEFQFKNLTPGDYELMASKHLFETEEQSVSVEEANITEISFSLSGTPYPEFSSTWVDFGFESTQGSIIISNAGRGVLQYHLTPNQDWITVEPDDGKITTGADTIKVTIDRTNLQDRKYEEEIYCTYIISGEAIQENIDVLLNGLVDKEGNCYSIVTIGTQTWMQESLNTGVQTQPKNQSDNQIIEKWCYDDDAANCETYGGLYTWTEMMDYSPPDSGIIGTTQGICPDGWHIPTSKEVRVLAEYLGGTYDPLEYQYTIAGGRMKSSSPLWDEPNLGNCDSGFEALPGGFHRGDFYAMKESQVYFWTSDAIRSAMLNATEWLSLQPILKNDETTWGLYLRCIKDPE